MLSKKILTVTELNKSAKKLLEDKFSRVWVQGEISRFTHHSSGHMYFTIKDSGCAVDAVMFRGDNMNLEFKPCRGVEVLLKGRLSIFTPQGRYQLVAEEMKKKGAGELEEKFRKLKERLFKEGLFDETHKKKVPSVPRMVGIVTSPTGAAVKDILNVIKRRFSNMDIIIFPCRVQGELAASEIVEGVNILNEKYPLMDAMIIGRGGGSLEDLWPFNEEEVARALFGSRIPVISAVGHEIDFTISDFVADLRAPTPSAAAELIVKNRQDLIIRLNQLVRSMNSSIKNKKRILSYSLKNAALSGPFRYPFRMVEDRHQQLDYFAGRIETLIKHNIEINIHKLNNLGGKIKSLSPRHTLERGYTITRILPEKNNLKGPEEAYNDDYIETVFSSGSLRSRVVGREGISKGQKYD